MGFEQGYTRKNLLKRRAEEISFNNLVNQLTRQKHITKTEAREIALERLKQRRRNALKFESSIVDIQEKEEEKRLARIRRAEKEKARLQEVRKGILQRQRARYSIREAKKRKLEEKETQQHIRESMRRIPRERDTIGTELTTFEGRVSRFLEPLRYGVSTAQKLTGKSWRMILTGRNGLLNQLNIWYDKKQRFMSIGQKKRYQRLIARLRSLRGA